MHELLREVADTQAKNQKSERERMLEGVLPTPYEQMLRKLKMVDKKQAEEHLPVIELAKIVRQPGDLGPVGPTGRIEDLVD